MAIVEPEQFRFTAYKKSLNFKKESEDFGCSSSLESCCLNDLIIGICRPSILQSYKVGDLDKAELTFDAKGKNESLLPHDLPLPRMDASNVVVIVSISCDDEFLIAVHSKKPEYFLSCYALDGLSLLCTVGCGKQFPRCLKFNPVLNNSFAMTMSSGNVQVCQIEKKNICQIIDKLFEATALCWSPKGKQILVGTCSGQIVQITPQGDVKRIVRSPHFPGCCIEEIVWISTYHFICAFNQDPDAIFYSVSLQKDASQPPSVEEIPDVLMSAINVPESAKMNVFMKHIPEWKIVICASSKSSDIAVIANIGGNDKWVVMMLDENARAQLPIPKGSDDDSLCVGICVNFCSSRKIQRHKAESGENQEWPVLFVKSHFGNVYAYNVIYEGFSGNQKICIKPKGFQNLSLESKIAVNNFDSSQATRYSNTKMQNPSFSVDEKVQQMNNTAIGAGNNASAFQKPLQEPDKTSVIYSKTGNLEVKSTIKASVKSKAETIKATKTLLRLFEEDLKMLADSSSERTISNDRSLAELQLRTTEMLKFKTELKTQLESLARDVQMLTNAHLHTFKVVNRTKSVHEKNNDERYQSFLKSAPLAPDLQRLSESIHTSKAFIELRSREILALIDNLNWKHKKQTSDDAEYYENLNAILQNNYRTIMAMGLKVDGLVAKYDGKIDAMSNMRKNLPNKSGFNASMFPKVSGMSLLDLNSSVKDLDMSGKTKDDFINQNANEVDLPSDRINEIKDFLSRRTKVPMNKIPEIVSMKSQPTLFFDLKDQSHLNVSSKVDKENFGLSPEIVAVECISSQREARVKMLDNLRESVYLSQQPPSDKDAPVVNVKDLNMMQNMNPVQTSTVRSGPIPTFPNARLSLEPNSSRANSSNVFVNAESNKTDANVLREPPKYTPPTDSKQSVSGVSSNHMLNKGLQQSEGLAFMHKSSSSASFFGSGVQTVKPKNEASAVTGASSGPSLLNTNSNQQNRIKVSSATYSASGVDLLLPNSRIVSAANVSLNRSSVLPNSQAGTQSAFSAVSGGVAHGDPGTKQKPLPNTGNLYPVSKNVTAVCAPVTNSVLPQNDAVKSSNTKSSKSVVLFPNQPSDKGPQFVDTQDLKDSVNFTATSCQQILSSRTSIFDASASQASSNQAFITSNNANKSELSNHAVPSNIFGMGKTIASTCSLDKSGSSVSTASLSNTTVLNEPSTPSIFGYGAIPKPPEKPPSSDAQTTQFSKDSTLGSRNVVGVTSIFTAPESVRESYSGFSNFCSVSKENLSANSSSAGLENTAKTSTSVFDKSSSSLFQSPSSTIASLLGQKITVATGQTPEKTSQQHASTNQHVTSSAPSFSMFLTSTAASQPQSNAPVGGTAEAVDITSIAASQQMTSAALTLATSDKVGITEAKEEQKTASGSGSLPGNTVASVAASIPKPSGFSSSVNTTTLTSNADIVSQSQTNPNIFPATTVSSSTPSGRLFDQKSEPKSSSVFGVTVSASSSISTLSTNVATSQPLLAFGQLPTTSNQVNSPFGNQNTVSSIFGEALQKPSSGWLNNGQQNANSEFVQMTPNNAVPKNIFGQTGSSPFGASATNQTLSPFGQTAQVPNASADVTGSILGSNAFSGLGSAQPTANSTSNPFGSAFAGSIGTSNLTSSPFGQNSIASTPQTQSNLFGNASNSPFGQNIQNTNTPTTIFGKPAGGGSVFGAAATSQGPVFGQSATNSAFGGSPAAAPIFGKTPVPAFGQAAAFGSGMPAFGGGPVFGSPSSSVFGKNAASPSGVFGSQSATNSMQTFGGLVGGGMNNQTPAFGANNSISSPFGANGSAFGGPMSGGTSSPFGTSAGTMGGSSFSSWRS